MKSASFLGATYMGNGFCRFEVWAPEKRRVEIHVVGDRDRIIPLEPTRDGYFNATAGDLPAGTRYFVRLDGESEFPDPASRYQPEGVHGPSEVIDPEFPWSDGDHVNPALHDYVIYELHTGTFSEAGTFEGAVPQLPELVDLGITAVELMPVAQFPGARNWGYDGVDLYAVQNSYGGPEGLKRFVDAAHGQALAVILDVVYNHLGPEGNYLNEFGPYFTDRYRTPWGNAINFGDAESDHVRRFFIENALYWFREFHVDALRLDAVHAIEDPSAHPFLAELSERVHAAGRRLGRQWYLMPESDANDPRLVRNADQGGYGFDAQWADDFHHAVHALCTGEQHGYYADFGRVAHLQKAFEEGYVYTGEYSPFRYRRHGASTSGIPSERFIVCAQNHDQVGNRALGERLNALAGLEALKTASAAVLLAPFVPLLFMGQEYGETAPFQYFVDHGDPKLLRAVRKGRAREFAGFKWTRKPPDPGAAETFLRSKLNHDLRDTKPHRSICAYTRALLELRRTHPAAAVGQRGELTTGADEENRLLTVHRVAAGHALFLLLYFRETGGTVEVVFPEGEWRKVLDSSETDWAGAGSSLPAVLEGDTTHQLSLRTFCCAVYDGNVKQA